MFKVLILFCTTFLTVSSSPSQDLLLDAALAKATSVDPITLAAVGRVAVLGELYDARIEKFLGISLGNFSSIVEQSQNRYSNIKYMEESTLSEKMRHLDVQAGFKLSIIWGLIEVSGSGQYLNDEKRNSRSVKVSVANFMTTDYERIDIASADGRKFIDLDILGGVDATHVVVGVQWGGNVIVSVEDYNSENRDKEVIKGSLSGQLKLAVASFSLNGQAELSEEEKREMNKFSFELYGDILLDETPTSIVAAIELMTDVPKLLTESNNGKGKKMSYRLIPIAVFRELLSLQTEINSYVAFFDESTINSCIKLFEEISDVKLKVNDLMDELNKFQNYVTRDKIDKISNFTNRYQLYQYDLRHRLSRHLILIRSGNESTSTLIEALDEAYNHELSPYNIDFDQFFSIQTEFRFVEFLTSLSVYVLEKTITFNEYLSKNWNKNVYALFYTVDFPNISDEPMIAFRQILESLDSFDETGIFVAIKIDVLRDIERESFFNFDAPNRLRVYKNGVCVVDDYSTSSDVMPNTNPELWSFRFMQKQVVEVLTKNPVPVGYVYVQYPTMFDPETLWPLVEWTEITSRFNGTFFRAEGGSSRCFDCGIQADESPRIHAVLSTDDQVGDASNCLSSSTLSICPIVYVPQEYFSPSVEVGGYGDGGDKRYLTFLTQYEETRPKNMAIKIWQRTA